ncbi:MAG: hypothetical protein C4555_06405 [Dehalococcoidia bacterium]|nr:MAG: hypothetical protein C4555_06405 [Dehalococcoidia bacterium]
MGKYSKIGTWVRRKAQPAPDMPLFERAENSFGLVGRRRYKDQGMSSERPGLMVTLVCPCMRGESDMRQMTRLWRVDETELMSVAEAAEMLAQHVACHGLA